MKVTDESLLKILSMDGRPYRKGKKTLNQITKEYRNSDAWKKPFGPVMLEHPDVKGFMKELTEHHIKHAFDIEEYERAGRYFRDVFPYFFDIPGGDFTKIISGTEKVKENLGEEGVKLVFFAGPHNMHADEIIAAITMYDSGLGAINIGARTNMFIGPGDKMHKWGSIANSFHSGKMTNKMRKVSEVAIENNIETVLKASNVPFVQKNHDIISNIWFWGYNGRAYPTGNLKARATKNVTKLYNILKKNPELKILTYPVTFTVDRVPEQDALPNLAMWKKFGGTLGYIIRDFYEIQKSLKRGIKGSDARSYVHVEIHDPIEIKYDPNRTQVEQEKETIEKVWRPIETNYLVTPEKLLAEAIVMADSNIQQNEYFSEDEILENAELALEQHAAAGNRIELVDTDLIGRLKEATDSYVRDGTIRTGYLNRGIRVKKPHVIEYQNQTLSHLRVA